LTIEGLSSELLTPLVVQLGFGGLAGFAIGYAIKKLLKLVIILIGIFLLGMAYLDYVDFIEVHYEKLAEAFRQLAERLLSEGGFLPGLLSANLPAMGGFVVGFALGFKKG